MTETKAAYCYFTKSRDFLCQITNVEIDERYIHASRHNIEKKEHKHSQNKTKLQKLVTNSKNEML